MNYSSCNFVVHLLLLVCFSSHVQSLLLPPLRQKVEEINKLSKISSRNLKSDQVKLSKEIITLTKDGPIGPPLNNAQLSFEGHAETAKLQMKSVQRRSAPEGAFSHIEPKGYPSRMEPPPMIQPPSIKLVILPPGMKRTPELKTEARQTKAERLTTRKYSHHKEMTSQETSTPIKEVKNTWNMTGPTGNRCIMLKGDLTFNIPYITKDRVQKMANMTIPKDANLTENSKCMTNNGSQLVELEFDGNLAKLEFVKKRNITSLDKIALDYTVDAVRFPNAINVGQKMQVDANNVHAFPTPQDKSYGGCPKPTSITMSDGVSLLANNIQLDVFKSLTSNIFSTPTGCLPDPNASTSSLPATVGGLVATAIPAGSCLIKFIKDRKGKKSKT